MSPLSESLNSVFIGSFNINNAELSSEDAATWLSKAKDADLVVLGFQECGSCRAVDSVVPSLCYPMDQKAYCRIRGDEMQCSERNERFLSSIRLALTSDHKLLADVAMGESASDGKFSVMDRQVAWYGFIRLLVFAKNEYVASPSIACRTLVCPVGTKQTLDIGSLDYPDQKSPDKGAVGVIIGDLLIVNVHLQGTNKYNVPEHFFDEIRRQQLHDVGEFCKSVLGAEEYSKLRRIVFGDLNYRCEVNPTGKERGGSDFLAVHSIITSGDDVSIRKLFETKDRLLGFLRSQEKHPHFPCLVRNMEDAFHCGLKNNGRLILPTFTVYTGQHLEHQRYSDKRAPSWTDRVLLPLNFHDLTITSVASHREITVSDHLPIHCLLEKRRKK